MSRVSAGLLFGFLHRWPALWRRIAGSSLGWLPMLTILGIVAVIGSVIAFFVIPPDRWGIPGGIIGAAGALPLEYRFVRLVPAPGSHHRPRLESVGLGGLLPPMFVGLLVIDELPLVSAALTGLAAFWGLLLAPLLFVRLGLAKHG